MPQIYIKWFNAENNSNELRKFQSDFETLDELSEDIRDEFGLQAEFVLVTKTGVKLNEQSIVQDGDQLQLCPLVLGGKGGFGSLLRSFGKQINKSTNKDACRDLTGRRMRHVNNEKRLKEFMEKQTELAKEKEHKKQERVERRRKKREQLESSHHLFLDPKYDEQKQKIADDLEHAISLGIKNKRKLVSNNDSNEQATTSSSSSGNENESSNDIDSKLTPSEPKSKRIATEDESKPTSSTAVTTKLEQSTASASAKDMTTNKFKDWLGVGDLDVSSSSDDEEQHN